MDCYCCLLLGSADPGPALTPEPLTQGGVGALLQTHIVYSGKHAEKTHLAPLFSVTPFIDNTILPPLKDAGLGYYSFLLRP